MREIWIRAKDLRPGDRFDYWGRILVAEEIHCSDEGVNVRVFLAGWTGGWKNPESPVLLLQRPWPEGKEENDMWREVTALASELYDQILPSLRAIELAQRLREAIEAYELGKPLKVRA